MENLKPLRQSNFSTACIRPRLPSWIRSSSGRPEAWYFLAIETTRRRFDWTNVCWACSPSITARRSSRFFAVVRPLGALATSASAARPASMAWARRTSSSLVSSGYWPMSVRYSRTRSSSSRSIRSFAKISPNLPSHGPRQGGLAGLSRSLLRSRRPFLAYEGCGDIVMALSRWPYSRENARLPSNARSKNPRTACPASAIGLRQPPEPDGRGRPRSPPADSRRASQDLQDRAPRSPATPSRWAA